MPLAAASFSWVPAGTGRAGCLFTRSLFLLCRLNPMNPTITCEYECCTIGWTMTRNIGARLFPENISVFSHLGPFSFLEFGNSHQVFSGTHYPYEGQMCPFSPSGCVYLPVCLCSWFPKRVLDEVGHISVCLCACARARVLRTSTLCAMTICIFRVMGFVRPLFCWWPGCIHGNIRFDPGCELVRGTWKGSDTPLLSFALSSSRSDHG